MEPHDLNYVWAYIPAVIFFLGIIGGIILLGSRDKEYKH